MSAPNLKSPTTITGKTAVQVVSNTATAIVTNAASSGKLLRVGMLTVNNVYTTAQQLTVEVYRSSTAYRIAYKVGITLQSPFIMIGRDEPLYLEEGDSLRLKNETGSNAYLEAVCSYEEIS